MSAREAAAMVRRLFSSAVMDGARCASNDGLATSGAFSRSVRRQGSPLACHPLDVGIYGSGGRLDYHGIGKALGRCGIDGSGGRLVHPRVGKALGGCGGIYGSGGRPGYTRVGKALGGGGGIFGSAVGHALGGRIVRSTAVNARFFSHKAADENVVQAVLRKFWKQVSSSSLALKGLKSFKKYKAFLDRIVDFIETNYRLLNEKFINVLCFIVRYGYKLSDGLHNAIGVPLELFLNNLWLRLRSCFLKANDPVDKTPPPPKEVKDLLVDIWEKVHAIDKIVQLPAKKSAFHQFMLMVFKEKVGGFLYTFISTGDEVYKIFWQAFTFVGLGCAYVSLGLTPTAAIKLYLKWCKNQMRKNLEEISELTPEEGSNDDENGDSVICWVCSKICPEWSPDGSDQEKAGKNSAVFWLCKFCKECSHVNALQAPSTDTHKAEGTKDKKVETGGSVVCKVCAETLNSENALVAHSNAKPKASPSE